MCVEGGGVVLSGGNGGRDDLEVLRLAGLCEGFTYSPTTPLITLSWPRGERIRTKLPTIIH